MRRLPRIEWVRDRRLERRADRAAQHHLQRSDALARSLAGMRRRGVAAEGEPSKARVREGELRGEAERQVGGREDVVRAVGPVYACQDVRVGEVVGAGDDRGGQEGVGAGQAREVDDGDGVDGLEERRDKAREGIVFVIGGREVLTEVGDALLSEGCCAVMVAEPDARGYREATRVVVWKDARPMTCQSDVSVEGKVVAHDTFVSPCQE